MPDNDDAFEQALDQHDQTIKTPTGGEVSTSLASAISNPSSDPVQRLKDVGQGAAAAGAEAVRGVNFGVGKTLGAIQDTTHQFNAPIEWGLNKINPDFEKAYRSMEDVPFSALGKFGQVVGKYGTMPIKYAASKLVGQGTDAQTPYSELMEKSGVPHELAENLGTIAEPVANVANFAFPFGKTAKGVEAAKAGQLEATLGKRAAAGQQSLLTAQLWPNTKPIQLSPSFVDKPVMAAMSRMGAGMRPLVRGFSTTTGDKAFDDALDKHLQEKSYAASTREKQIENDRNFINEQAEKSGLHPEELRDKLNQIFEPNESGGKASPFAKQNIVEDVSKNISSMNSKLKSLEEQGKDVDNFRTKIEAKEDPMYLVKQIQQAKNAQGKMLVRTQGLYNSLSPELQDFINQKIENSRQMLSSPAEKFKGVGDRLNYLPHDRTPQLAAWESSRNSEGVGLPTSVNNPNTTKLTSARERDVPLNPKEANEYGYAGRLNELPEFSNPKFAGYKGPVFSKQTEELWAQREYESKVANSRHDFMDTVGKISGTDKRLQDSLVGAGKRDAHDYIEVHEPQWESKDNPTGIKAFPKEIGLSLKAIKNPEITTGISKFASLISKPFKDLNFGVFWGPSLAKIFAGNQVLAATKGLWSPVKIAQEVAREGRRITGKLTDADKQFIDLAQKHGGEGMGYARAAQTDADREVYKEAYESARQAFEKKQIPPWVFKALKSPADAIDFVAQIGYGMHKISENATRRATFGEAMRQGYTPEAAGKVTGDTLYNYSRMGKTDEAIRKFVPFYTFFRKNTFAMLKNMVTKPGMMAMPGQFQQAMMHKFGVTPEDQKTQTPYQLESMGIPVSKNEKTGDITTVDLLKYLPLVDVNKLFGTGSAKDILEGTPSKTAETAWSTVHPAFTSLFDAYLFNKDPWSGKTIEDIPGQKALGPFGSSLPVKENYILSKLRPWATATRMENPNITPVQKAANLGLGLNFKTWNPGEQYIYQMMGNKAEAAKDKTFMNRFQRASARNYGTAQGSVDQENFDKAFDAYIDAKTR